MISDVQESMILENVVVELRAEGYEVYPHPRSPIVPPILKNFAPDAIAVRNGKKLVIEISKNDARSKARLEMLRELLDGQEEWELKLFHLERSSSSPKLIEPTSRAKIEASLASVDSLLKEHRIEPALLQSWATFEALARRLYPDRFQRPQTPGRLVEILASEGDVTPSEADLLRSLAESRNLLVHGTLHTEVSEPGLAAFVALIRNLLTRVNETADVVT